MGRAAVLVGCLYRNRNTHPPELKGCINDVFGMKSLLIGTRFDFKEENILVLTDDTHIKATKKNIMIVLNLMIDNAGPEDVLLFFFSGYGICGNQRAIVPLDALDGNNAVDANKLITSDDLQTLVKKLPSGATLTIVASSGHSGGLIDGQSPQIQTSSSKIESHNEPETKLMSKSFRPSPSMSPSTNPSPIMGATGTESDGGILLSASHPTETAFDVVPSTDPAYGAFTHAIKVVLDEHPERITNKQLVTYASEKLSAWQLNQHPGLYCSKQSENAIFLLQSARRLH